MNAFRNIPLITIILSLFSSALCTLLPGRAARRFAMITEGILVALALLLLGYTLRAGEAFTYPMGEFPAPWGNEIRAGVLEAMMAVFFLVIMLFAVSRAAFISRRLPILLPVIL